MREWFKRWRRRPFKMAIALAYERGVINSFQLHELAELIDRA